MLRRIAMLIVFGAATLTVAIAFVAWYQGLQPVPYRSYYTAPCEQDAAATWCGSLQRIFAEGAILLGAGVVLLVVGLILGALVIWRMARQHWLTSGVATLAGLTGGGALWFSQQALEAYYNLSLFPDRSPPEFLSVRLAAIDRISQTYMAWSVGAVMLAVAMLIFSFVILWSARKLPPQAIALSPAV
ncbi:MAG TPA: hypothetical protein VH393_09960 [Ktedonobacterales bacterium]|jgi:hypothetical protein